MRNRHPPDGEPSLRHRLPPSRGPAPASTARDCL